MAVIKAEGYGHGMLRVASALENADGFAVLTLEEALALRQAGFRQTILLLEGFFSADELPPLACQDIATVVHCREQIDALAEAALPRKVEVFLKINTGMNRLGILPEALPGALERLRRSPAVGALTLMTHFATADEADGVEGQLACFNRLSAGLGLPRTAANSAAILRYPHSHLEWVRPGIMLYGSSPFAGESAESLGLEPAMTLRGEVIAVQDLQAGEACGYGHAFRAERPARVGVVACGYADGYPRHAPTGTPILVNGSRTRTLGRVSMDMLFVDLTELPDAGIGSPVVLWGKGMPVEEVARAAGTISYELLCARAGRVPVADGK
jgi:alanine racemase